MEIFDRLIAAHNRVDTNKRANLRLMGAATLGLTTGITSIDSVLANCGPKPVTNTPTERTYHANPGDEQCPNEVAEFYTTAKYSDERPLLDRTTILVAYPDCYCGSEDPAELARLTFIMRTAKNPTSQRANLVGVFTAERDQAKFQEQIAACIQEYNPNQPNRVRMIWRPGMPDITAPQLLNTKTGGLEYNVRAIPFDVYRYSTESNRLLVDSNNPILKEYARICGDELIDSKIGVIRY